MPIKSIWVTFFIFIAFHSFSVTALKYDIPFEEYFYNYDLSVMQLLKSDPLSKTYDGARFEATGKMFEVKFEIFDRNVFSRNASLEIHKRNANIEIFDIFKEMPEVIPVEGILDGEPTSKVFGHIIDDVFAGVVLFTGGVLIVEPLSRYADVDADDQDQVVVYRSSDIKIQGFKNSKQKVKSGRMGFGPDEYFGIKYTGCEDVRSGYKICFHEEIRPKNKTTSPPVADNKRSSAFETSSFAQSAGSNTPIGENKACSLEILIDKSYFDNRGRNKKWTVAEAVLLIKIADSVFRAEDFDSDGYDDNLRIVLDRVVIFSDDLDSLPNGNRTGEEELELMRSHNQRNCLSIMISNVLLKSPDQVSAFIVPDSKLNGGICSHGSSKGRTRPTNVAILTTAAPPPRKRRPLFVIAVVLTHMIGLTMGSDTKPCPFSPYDPSTLFGLQSRLPRKLRYREHKFFNSCAAKNMLEVLLKREKCFQTEWSKLTAVCGNGFVDPGEDCDCGSKTFCEYVSSCCIPPGKDGSCHYPEGIECDWMMDPCCSINCNIMPADSFFCQKGDPICYDGGYCDGKSKKCPFTTKKMEGIKCGDHNECNIQGQCVPTTCKSAGFAGCKCPSNIKNYECQICCSALNGSGSCFLAKEKGIFGKNSSMYVMPVGTFCRNNEKLRSGSCDSNGECI